MEVLRSIYFWVAIAASVILVLQLVMSLLGLSGDTDVNFDSDSGDFGGDGFNLFSLRAVISFLTVAAWSGYILLLGGTKVWVAVPVSFVLGIAAMFIVAFLLFQILKLQSSGNIDASQAVGRIATVYLTVPNSPDKFGKVNLVLQDRLSEFEASTKCGRDIKTGEQVKIVDIEGNVLIVEPLSQ